jgi:hypothetical protein
MSGRQMNTWLGRAAAVGGLGALLVTYGCGGQNVGAVRAQEVAGGAAGAPVVVTCEPNQRTLVRPTIVNGAAMSQVECVSVGQAPVDAQTVAAPLSVPVGTGYSAARVARDARDAELLAGGPAVGHDARVIPASYPVATARPIRTQQIVYDDRPVRVVKRGRSVKKSAVIIGSSAGIGAGVGAAVGGKKGALIGAVVGGGGATLWDQITRRRN